MSFNTRPVLTCAEVAKALRLTQTTVRLKVDRGELAGFRIGKTYRVYADAIAQVNPV